ncbi:heparan-alpha-glucosaminide N-acetyltransferase domain-containing protein [Burkholderia multivorans]|nr:heparan-alpha-glucosaminide N-acetyltransferase domain-containing protein [Burkholderia multivorans]
MPIRSLPAVPTTAGARLIAIDALRGLVMLLMLVDHVRETFFLHRQVSDPMDALTVDPALFFTRLTSQLCAPAFVFLTGLSAWLYGRDRPVADTASFLVKRGAFLIFLEVTFVSFAWTAEFPPSTLWLQVIWAIGLSMLALAALLRLPRGVQFALGVAIVAGHNLLDGIRLEPDSAGFVPWAILHQRAFIDLWDGVRARTSYPVLPWIGVILLGYAAGPWFARGVAPGVRMRRLATVGIALVVAYVALRGLNVYGDKPWIATGDALRTTLLLLAVFERRDRCAVAQRLATLGGAPMFFYLLHLYVLKALYLVALATFGANQGNYFGFDALWGVWLASALLIVPLYWPAAWFARLKQRRKEVGWLKYL